MPSSHSAPDAFMPELLIPVFFDESSEFFLHSGGRAPTLLKRRACWTEDTTLRPQNSAIKLQSKSSYDPLDR